MPDLIPKALHIQVYELKYTQIYQKLMSQRKLLLFYLHAIDPESFNPLNPNYDKLKEFDWKNDC